MTLIRLWKQAVFSCLAFSLLFQAPLAYAYEEASQVGAEDEEEKEERARAKLYLLGTTGFVLVSGTTVALFLNKKGQSSKKPPTDPDEGESKGECVCHDEGAGVFLTTQKKRKKPLPAIPQQFRKQAGQTTTSLQEREEQREQVRIRNAEESAKDLLRSAAPFFPFLREYDIEHPHFLGKGAFGLVVRLNSRTEDGEAIAIKISHADEKTEIADLRREVHNLDQLRNSPAVIHHLAHHELYRDIEASTFFIAMELADGDLDALLDNGYFSDDYQEGLVRAIQIASDLIQALRVLKTKKLHHWDIKPGNIFIRKERAVLGDLGLSAKIKRLGGIKGMQDWFKAKLSSSNRAAISDETKGTPAFLQGKILKSMLDGDDKFDASMIDRHAMALVFLLMIRGNSEAFDRAIGYQDLDLEDMSPRIDAFITETQNKFANHPLMPIVNLLLNPEKRLSDAERAMKAIHNKHVPQIL